MGPGSGPIDVVGRELEQARIRDWVLTLAAGSTVGPLVLHGEAGMGKTTLWRIALDVVAASGGLSTTSRPGQSDLSLGYAGLSDLLSRQEDVWAPVLPPHLATALRTALMLAPGTGGDDRLAVYRGAQLALEAVAQTTPFLVVAVDDVQWLDPASAAALAYALRRWSAGPLGLVVSWRSGLEEPLGVTTFGGEPHHVEVGSLPRDRLDVLVTSRVGRQLTTARLDDVWRISGGNPFYALEIARAPEGVEVPATLADAATRQLRAARAEARPAIEVAAVCGPAPARLFAELGLAASLDGAVEDRVLVFDTRDGVTGMRGLRFGHPLLAWAAYQGLAPGRRQALHREAAARATSVEERAMHLARAADEPDESIARQLDAAARHAARRNAVEAAAAFAEEAVRLTDDADRSSLTRRLVDMAWWQRPRQPAEATAAADLAISRGARGRDRGRALYVRMETATSWEEYFRYAALAGAEGGLDASLVADLRSDAAWAAGALQGGDLAAACEQARGALEDDDGYGGAVRIGCLATLGSLLSLAGDASAEQVFKEALTLARPGLRPSNGKHARDLYAMHLAARGYWDQAIRLLDDEERDATLDGNDGLLGLLHWTRAWIELTHGDTAELRRRLDALEIVSLRTAFNRDFWAKTTAVTQARRGDATAVATAGESREISFDALVLGPEGLRDLVTGLLLVAQGRPEEAAASFDLLAATIPRAGILRSELLGYLPEAVAAMVAAGRLHDAELLVATIDQPTRNDPLATPLEDLCLGVLALGKGEPVATDLLARAQSGAVAIGARWFEAQAAYAHGLALRRGGRRTSARECFDHAARLFSQMDAPPWAERASQAAEAVVPRPSHDDVLTTAETRVAELAASGLRNTEIAARLFVSVATVEAHLTRVYRKLGVRSRTGLSVRLGRVTT
jgi:DNA-binding CsgD family transcriptional regulator